MFFRIFLLLSIVLLSCQPAFPLKQPFHFQRIVSLGPVLTEGVFLLGRGDDLAADTIYCIYPEAAKRKEKIGSITDINVEKIYRLQPGLVLASPLTDGRQLEKLKSMKLHVEIFGQPESFRGICGEFLRLSKLLDREDLAKGIVDRAENEVSNLVKKISIYPKKRVFVEIGTNPLFTAGEKSFINDFIIFGGGVNIASDSGVGIYSSEMVLKKDPEVIIISDMGIDNGHEKDYWRRYKSVSAVKNHAIFSIDSYHLCSPTPVSFVQTLDEIALMIHPEFKERAGGK